jgi:hypothetical protein
MIAVCGGTMIKPAKRPPGNEPTRSPPITGDDLRLFKTFSKIRRQMKRERWD